jgi:hypothetical protein
VVIPRSVPGTDASYLGAALHFTTSPNSKALMETLTPLVDANLVTLTSTKGRR